MKFVLKISYSLFIKPTYTVFICALGWVDLYQKFKIEKYTVCGKLILPKERKDI